MSTGTFHGADIDYSKEYVEARKLMGHRDTDLDQLSYSVGLLYVNCPEDLTTHYAALLEEITTRQSMITMRNLFTPRDKS